MPMLRIAIVAATACLAGLHQAEAQGRTETAAVELGWRSTPGNEEAVAGDLERLYLALYNTGNLAIREAENPDGRFVERLMRQEGLFHGTYFPHGIDNLLCDLNQKLCSRQLTPVAESQLSDITSHVGGYGLSKPQWSFGPGVTMVLPDYGFMPYSTLRKMPVPAGWSPDDYRTQGDVSCSAWGADCADLVRSLNPQSLKGPGKGESIAVLPVSGIETRFRLKPDPLTRHAEPLDRVGAAQQVTVVSFADPDLLGFAPAWRDRLTRTSPTDELVAAVEANLLPIGQGTKYGVRDEPLFERQVDLFRLIHHPFSTADELDDVYKNPVNVLLLDGDFVESHCDFPQTDAAPAESEGEACAEIVESTHPLTDHASHIFGSISAPVNGRGIVGLNPSAKVSHTPINTDFSAPDDILKVVEHLLLALQRDVRIANLSWGFDRQLGGDIFELGVGALDKTILIVAAAGNDNQNLTDDCRIFPACMHDGENVITVVGLDRNESDPALWKVNSLQGSNSSTNFHIAAIAEDILSTVQGNKLGLMSGTSQAAPQVTAAASLIYSAAEQIHADLLAGSHRRLPPKIVKDRLIYTADIFPGLQTSVQSGRLNVGRAIDIVDTQLVLQRPEGPVSLKGRLVQIPNDIITCLKPDNTNEAHNWASIRRLSFIPERQRYVIFKNEDPDDRESELQRVDNCNLSSLSHVGKILKQDRTEVEFSLREIVDYTSTLLQ